MDEILIIQMVSIIDVVSRYVPTKEDQTRRDRWLYSLGPKMTRADLLGIRGHNGYIVLPLTRVWDWVDTPYQYPITARDWYIVLQGIPESRLKEDFIIQLTHGINYHTGVGYTSDALNTMEYDNGTLIFNPDLDMFLIISP